MKFKELKTKPDSELDQQLIDLKLELIKINAQVATGTTPKSPGQLKQIKKTIAKIFTLKKQKEGKKKQ